MGREISLVRQIWVSDPVTLCNVAGTGGGPAVSFEWRTSTPDSRLRTKVTLLFSPTPGQTFPADLTTMGATLYLFEEEQDYSGQAATLVPSVALDGSTKAAPIVIPKSGFLMGYSREFVTAGDAIHGIVSVPTPGIGISGAWVAQARWQPDGQRLPADEWSDVKRLCNVMSVAGVQSV